VDVEWSRMGSCQVSTPGRWHACPRRRRAACHRPGSKRRQHMCSACVCVHERRVNVQEARDDSTCTCTCAHLSALTYMTRCLCMCACAYAMCMCSCLRIWDARGHGQSSALRRAEALGTLRETGAGSLETAVSGGRRGQSSAGITQRWRECARHCRVHLCRYIPGIYQS